MPIAVAKIDSNGERFDLESIPEGYVVLKRLSYGQQMFRRGLLSKAKMETGGGGGNRAERRERAKQSFTAELELMNEKVTLFEFANCILDHNLTYLVHPEDASSEQKLDFKNPDHVKMLDGRIGAEIDELINDLNNFESEDETGK